MDIKEQRVMVADETGEQPIREQRVLIVDDAGGMPAGVFGSVRDLGLKPGEMWPDGKVRPHKVSLYDGKVVHLTQDEFDRLVLAERHRQRANKVGPSSAPRPDLKAGDSVQLGFTGGDGAFPPVFATVRKVKADRRVIIEHVFCLAELTGEVCTINGVPYKVLRSSGGSATLRQVPS